MAEHDSQPADPGDLAIGQVATADAPEVVEAEDHDDFLGELARAMHTAAETQYERMTAELERRRAEEVDAIAARASSEVEKLKAGSEADIGDIDAWAKAETEKIKLARLRRIDARRERLASQLERHETIKAREVSAVEVAIDAHRTEIDAFFGRMERESDPATIARVAATLPPFPPLAKIAEEAMRGTDAEYASVDEETEPAPAADDLGADSNVSESRLKAVMDPTASRGADGETARPWEAEPYAISEAAGPRVADETEPPARVGASLLRAIPSIRPMAGRRDPRPGEEPDAQR